MLFILFFFLSFSQKLKKPNNTVASQVREKTVISGKGDANVNYN